MYFALKLICKMRDDDNHHDDVYDDYEERNEKGEEGF
jgi:hypothetical protein